MGGHGYEPQQRNENPSLPLGYVRSVVLEMGCFLVLETSQPLPGKNLPRRDGKLRPQDHKRRHSGQRQWGGGGAGALHPQDSLTDRWSLGGCRRIDLCSQRWPCKGLVLQWVAGLSGALSSSRQLNPAGS